MRTIQTGRTIGTTRQQVLPIKSRFSITAQSKEAIQQAAAKANLDTILPPEQGETEYLAEKEARKGEDRKEYKKYTPVEYTKDAQGNITRIREYEIVRTTKDKGYSRYEPLLKKEYVREQDGSYTITDYSRQNRQTKREGDITRIQPTTTKTVVTQQPVYSAVIEGKTYESTNKEWLEQKAKNTVQQREQQTSPILYDAVKKEYYEPSSSQEQLYTPAPQTYTSQIQPVASSPIQQEKGNDHGYTQTTFEPRTTTTSTTTRPKLPSNDNNSKPVVSNTHGDSRSSNRIKQTIENTIKNWNNPDYFREKRHSLENRNRNILNDWVQRQKTANYLTMEVVSTIGKKTQQIGTLVWNGTKWTFNKTAPYLTGNPIDLGRGIKNFGQWSYENREKHGEIVHSIPGKGIVLIKETGKEIKEKPVQGITGLVFDWYSGTILNKGITKGYDVYQIGKIKLKGGKEIKATDIYDKKALDKNGLSKSSGADETEKMFLVGTIGDTTTSTHSSKANVLSSADEVADGRTITKGKPKKTNEDEGLYISPIKKGSPHFLELPNNTIKTTGIEINPFKIQKPRAYVIESRKIERIPPSSLK